MTANIDVAMATMPKSDGFNSLTRINVLIRPIVRTPSLSNTIQAAPDVIFEPSVTIRIRT